jgi:dipeptidase
VNGGIGFMLRRIVCQQARTAREGVKLAGELIERYGYYGSGRAYCIADANEGWVLQAVKGKRWVAQRVPDHHVAVIANCYTVRRYNPQDKDNFLGSADIIDYAVRRKWYDPQKDGPFDFARVYGDADNLSSQINTLRLWRAANMLSRRKYHVNAAIPFSFRPRKQIKLTDLFRVLRDHYEGTEYDLTDHYKNGSPNLTRNRTICTQSTRYSLVAQLRNHTHAEIAHIVWIALSRPDANAFSPWYLSLGTPPSGYANSNAARAFKNHFTVKEPATAGAGNHAYRSCAMLADLVDQQYRKRRRIVSKEWDNLEDYAIKYIRKKDKELKYLLDRNKYIARQIITNYVHNLEYRRWFLVSEFIMQFRKKILKK